MRILWLQPNHHQLTSAERDAFNGLAGITFNDMLQQQASHYGFLAPNIHTAEVKFGVHVSCSQAC